MKRVVVCLWVERVRDQMKCISFSPLEHIKIVEFKNCCFVQFAELQSAMNAHQAAGGMNIRGHDLRSGWGRVLLDCSFRLYSFVKLHLRLIRSDDRRASHAIQTSDIRLAKTSGM